MNSNLEGISQPPESHCQNSHQQAGIDRSRQSTAWNRFPNCKSGNPRWLHKSGSHRGTSRMYWCHFEGNISPDSQCGKSCWINSIRLSTLSKMSERYIENTQQGKKDRSDFGSRRILALAHNVLSRCWEPGGHLQSMKHNLHYQHNCSSHRGTYCMLESSDLACTEVGTNFNICSTDSGSTLLCRLNKRWGSGTCYTSRSKEHWPESSCQNIQAAAGIFECQGTASSGRMLHCMTNNSQTSRNSDSRKGILSKFVSDCCQNIDQDIEHNKNLKRDNILTSIWYRCSKIDNWRILLSKPR